MTNPAEAGPSPLEKLPRYSGITWRGAPSDLIASMPVTDSLPTSRSPRVASENFTSACLLAIVSVAGRDVSPLSEAPAEREVAILAGATLVPASALHDIAGVPVQILLEVQPGEASPAVPTDATLASAIEAARGTADVSVRIPGRFCWR